MPDEVSPARAGPQPDGGADRGPGATIDRRRFLLGAAAGVGGVTAAVLAGGATGAAGRSTRIPARARQSRPPLPDVLPATLPSGVVVPVARWVMVENEKPGTIDWIVTGVQTPHAIEGFASHVSAVPGDVVTLYINTTARSVSMQAFRMGYYQGLGGRLVFESDTVAGQNQPPPTVTPGVNTVSCSWQPSISFKVDDTWPTGCYLLKIQGDGGEQQYVPLTVRDDSSTSAFVIQNSVTTWQAYNLWGGYSLYFGKNGSGQDFRNRARVVSFDRPYPQTWAQGCADFLGNEFPLLYDAERLGLDVGYWTDIDLHVNPDLVANHRCLFSLGHDEYWSTPMRAGAADALNKGTNLAFLGANACYRQIRLESSPIGPNRLQVCYKDAGEDPMASANPELTTVNWNQDPVNDPESKLIGSMYQSVRANDDLVVVDAAHWLLDGCGVTDGQRLPSVVQGEYDRYVPSLPGPKNVDVVAHSPVAHQGNWSDITYYTTPSGGGVLASGNASFVGKLANTTAFPNNVVPAAIPGVTDILLRLMENVYGTFGNGPASAAQPSVGNWGTVYQGSAATAASAQPTDAA